MPTDDAPATLARRILAQFGELDPQQLDLGASNDVWLGNDVVLRIGRGDVLRREAHLAQLLPCAVGYPQVLATGTDEDREWIVAERVPGENLGAVWSSLDGEQQRAAVVDLWTRLTALREVDMERAVAIGCTRSPFYALEPSDGYAQVRRLVASGALTNSVGDRVRKALTRGYDAISRVPQQLVHTDSGPHNAVWDGHRAIPLDFEFATVGPADLDVDGMLRHLLRTDPESPATQWFRAIAEQAACVPGGADRLLGYALLRDLWALELWQQSRISQGPIETWGPWQALHKHINADPRANLP